MPAVAEMEPSLEPTSCGDLPYIGDVQFRLQCGVEGVLRDNAHSEGLTFTLTVVACERRAAAPPGPVV